MEFGSRWDQSRKTRPYMCIVLERLVPVKDSGQGCGHPEEKVWSPALSLGSGQRAESPSSERKTAKRAAKKHLKGGGGSPPESLLP